MNADWLASPLLVFLLALGLAAWLHWLGGRWSPRGEESPGKRMPYACGEDLGPTEARLSYQRFFRLALLFVIVHMATLVVVVLPHDVDGRVLATIFLLGVAVCVDALTAGGVRS